MCGLYPSLSREPGDEASEPRFSRRPHYELRVATATPTLSSVASMSSTCSYIETMLHTLRRANVMHNGCGGIIAATGRCICRCCVGHGMPDPGLCRWRCSILAVETLRRPVLDKSTPHVSIVPCRLVGAPGCKDVGHRRRARVAEQRHLQAVGGRHKPRIQAMTRHKDDVDVSLDVLFEGREVIGQLVVVGQTPSSRCPKRRESSMST